MANKYSKASANCAVLSPDNDSHVSKATPLQTKIREIQESPQYEASAIDKSREQSTSRKRSNKETRPV